MVNFVKLAQEKKWGFLFGQWLFFLLFSVNNVQIISKEMKQDT